MNTPSAWERRLAGAARPLFGSAAIRFLAYLGLCAAYLQGGLVKLTDFPAPCARWRISACRRRRCTPCW